MCGCEDPENFVKLKFIGGFHKRGLERGPYLSYTTDEVYVLPERYADKESYPHFEYVGDATEDEIEDPWRTRLGLKPLPPKPKPKKEKFEVTGSTDSSEDESIDVVALSGEPEMTEFDSGGPPAVLEMLNGMDIGTLRVYVRGQGGQVDGRWGKNRLIQEALNLL